MIKLVLQPKYQLIFLGLVFFVLIFIAVNWARADIGSYTVKYTLEKWRKSKEHIPVSDVDLLVSKANALTGQWPNRAEYWELLAKVYWYRALYSEPDDSPKHIDLAITSYNHAIKLRPTWPYSWSARSLLLASKGQLDDEFYIGLYNATQYGPWEKSSNLMILESGLIAWGGLDKDFLPLVIQAAERVMKYDVESVKSLVHKYGKRYPVCAYLRKSKQEKRLCS